MNDINGNNETQTSYHDQKEEDSTFISNYSRMEDITEPNYSNTSFFDNKIDKKSSSTPIFKQNKKENNPFGNSSKKLEPDLFPAASFSPPTFDPSPANIETNTFSTKKIEDINLPPLLNPAHYPDPDIENPSKFFEDSNSEGSFNLHHADDVSEMTNPTFAESVKTGKDSHLLPSSSSTSIQEKRDSEKKKLFHTEFSKNDNTDFLEVHQSNEKASNNLSEVKMTSNSSVSTNILSPTWNTKSSFFPLDPLSSKSGNENNLFSDPFFADEPKEDHDMEPGKITPSGFNRQIFSKERTDANHFTYLENHEDYDLDLNTKPLLSNKDDNEKNQDHDFTFSESDKNLHDFVEVLPTPKAGNLNADIDEIGGIDMPLDTEKDADAIIQSIEHNAEHDDNDEKISLQESDIISTESFPDDELNNDKKEHKRLYPKEKMELNTDVQMPVKKFSPNNQNFSNEKFSRNHSSFSSENDFPEQPFTPPRQDSREKFKIAYDQMQFVKDSSLSDRSHHSDATSNSFDFKSENITKSEQDLTPQDTMSTDGDDMNPTKNIQSPSTGGLNQIPQPPTFSEVMIAMGSNNNVDKTNLSSKYASSQLTLYKKDVNELKSKLYTNDYDESVNSENTADKHLQQEQGNDIDYIDPNDDQEMVVKETKDALLFTRSDKHLEAHRLRKQSRKINRHRAMNPEPEIEKKDDFMYMSSHSTTTITSPGKDINKSQSIVSYPSKINNERPNSERSSAVSNLSPQGLGRQQRGTASKNYKKPQDLDETYEVDEEKHAMQYNSFSRKRIDYESPRKKKNINLMTRQPDDIEKEETMITYPMTNLSRRTKRRDAKANVEGDHFSSLRHIQLRNVAATKIQSLYYIMCARLELAHLRRMNILNRSKSNRMRHGKRQNVATEVTPPYTPIRTKSSESYVGSPYKRRWESKSRSGNRHSDNQAQLSEVVKKNVRKTLVTKAKRPKPKTDLGFGARKEYRSMLVSFDILNLVYSSFFFCYLILFHANDIDIIYP